MRLICAVTILTLAGALRGWAARSYWQGITFTTLTRATSTSSPSGILLVSVGWAGAVGVLALIGAIIVDLRFQVDEPYWALGIILAASCLAGSCWSRLGSHTFASLFKHVGFGEWFGAIVAGFALASITSAVPWAKAEGALRLAWATVVASAVIGFMLATNQFVSWPNTSRLINVLRPLFAQ